MQKTDTTCCPSCDSLASFLYPVRSIHTEGSDQEYAIYKCSSCQLGFTVPFGIDPSFYSDEGYGYERFKAQDIERRFRNKFYSKLISQYAKERILDVGCMFGSLLDELRSDYDVAGIELATEPCLETQSKGIDCFNGTVEDFSLSNKESFDTVVTFHTLEHTDNAETFLEAIEQILSKNGTLILAVPNFGNNRLLGRYWGWNLVPAHLYHFNKQALGRLLDKCGFVNTRFVTKGGDASFFLSGIYNILGLKGGKKINLKSYKLIHSITHWFFAKHLFHIKNDELIVIAEKP